MRTNTLLVVQYNSATVITAMVLVFGTIILFYWIAYKESKKNEKKKLKNPIDPAESHKHLPHT